VYSFGDVTIDPKPLHDPRPEILIGASNESSIRRAAKLTDGWLGAHVPFSVAREQVAAFRDAAAEVDGDRRVGFGREVFVAETTEAARDRLDTGTPAILQEPNDPHRGPDRLEASGRPTLVLDRHALRPTGYHSSSVTDKHTFRPDRRGDSRTTPGV
jgi:alkanesulfonate monooxygenase SsuD/methylene tetrahydromethanopterin reductase-like flavin-dependent oxidoreductase (luciferase family)